MKVFLAGCESRSWIIDELYGGNNTDDGKISHKPFILGSFYYMKNGTERIIKYSEDFMLDSGAFTFMENAAKANVNWEKYLELYAQFVVKNNVRKYFELDIDSLVGYEKVLEYRNKLEALTGIPPIPVWHPSRGKDDFLEMVQNYKYVALVE